jgi:hypothetical protein
MSAIATVGVRNQSNYKGIRRESLYSLISSFKNLVLGIVSVILRALP